MTGNRKDDRCAQESAPTQFNLPAITHEFRSPLHAILGLSEVLLDRDLDEESGALVKSIQREADALRVMVDDLLDLAKFEAGKMKLVISPLAPRALIDDVAGMFAAKASAKDLDLSVAFSDAVALAVRADRHRLRQVLVNLVSNAVKYTETGEIRITVTTGPDMDVTGPDGDRFSTSLIFVVSDTGPGIPDASLPLLFEPFEQVRQRDQISGTGLGLPITRELVDLMHGKLDVRTSVAGTRFTVIIPVGRAQRIEDDAVIAAEPLNRGRALVVDDSEVNRLLAQSQLDRLGVECKTVSNGKDALVALASDRFDIVLMDWHMPGLDGLETIRRFHTNIAPSLGTVAPIIMMTADATQDARRTCLENGASAFLPKPVSLNDLRTCLGEWILVASDTHADDEDTPSPQTALSVDRGAIEQMLADLGSSEVVHGVISTFRDDAPQRIASMSPDDQDPAVVQRAAHTLKSTAALLGAHQLSALCADIEQAAQHGTLPTPDALTAVSTEFATVTEDLTLILTTI